jgi:acetyl esterase/lipase
VTEPSATDAPAWEQRFRAVHVSLPEWAEDAPHRCLYVSNASGAVELYAWDRATDRHRQVTARPNGTTHGTLEPGGEAVWWFDDTDGDEFGTWMRQPFAGGPDEPAVGDLEPSYPAGLALGRDGLAVVGRSTPTSTTLHLCRRGEYSRVLYAHEQAAHVGDLSEDGGLVVVEHSEHGDSRHMALRVLRTADGSTVADLWDGPGKGLDALGFAPQPGDPRLLVGHERRGRPELLVWDVLTGAETELHLGLPGEVSGQWYRDASAVLVQHEHAARAELYRYDLALGALEPLGTPPGVVSQATCRPDGSVEYVWSDAAEPEVVRSVSGQVVLAPPGPAPARSVPVDDLWVDGHGGRIHALLSRPAPWAGSGPTPWEGSGPALPAVFLVHGGPTWQDSDAFSATVAAWVDHGFAVVRVNYRGSTGYGSAWRDALEARVGHTELEDIAAVRDALVEAQVIDPARIVLAGGSWGGYLTLLGLGTQPERWSVGIAAVPVADYLAAYEDEMEDLKAFDRSLFGGGPTEVPDRYEMSSPLTYVAHVRAPVLVLAGENDPRCPIRQVENYLARLQELDIPYEVYRFDAGHGSLVVEERIRQMRAELDFARRHLARSATVR